MSYSNDSLQLTDKLINLIRSQADNRLLFSEIARMVGQTFDCDVCLLLAGTNSSKTQVGFWDGKEVSALPFEITTQFFSQPSIANLIAKNELLEITNFKSDRAQIKEEWLEQLPLQSFLGLATSFQGKTNGIIMVGYWQPHQWTTQEKAWLKDAVDVSAIACHLSQLEQTKSKNPVKETNSSVSKGFSPDNNALFRKWYELTHQQLEQQRQLNQLKDEIITAISDRARNPLASMKMAMEMLNKDRNVPLAVEVEARYWEILKQEWHRLNDLIDNIVTLKRLESQEVSYNPELVALKPFIEDLGQSLQAQWQEDKRRQIVLATDIADDSLTVYTDPHHLKSILNELSLNAGNFAAPGTTVNISAVPQDNRMAIAVSNIGRGIAPTEQAYIFEPFRRGENAIEQSIPGVGLGLALVKKLVELLNGKIEVVSQPTDTPERDRISFTLMLPNFRDRQ
jgi:signal transduction histidine kinase